MADTLAIPPVYDLVRVSAYSDAEAQARRLVAEGAADGTLVWSERENVFDCAVVLSAEGSLADTLQLVPVAQLAVTEALAAAIDPGVKVAFRWPDIIDANDRPVGRIALVVPPGCGRRDTPDWIILAVKVAIMGTAEEIFGTGRETTSLHFERCLNVTSEDILVSFCRHLLRWVNRWLDDGFEPVRRSWVLRFTEQRETIPVTVGHGEGAVSGLFSTLNRTGDLVLKVGARRRVLRLADVVLA